jgi:hypothetical protein
VDVAGGTLSIPQLITHLQWIVPDSTYQWEVQQVEEHVFKVNFPSKVELVRVQHFGRFFVPDSTIVLSFDFWKKEVQPVWSPEDVWVRVHGLPPVALDDYLSLWALGDVFGKTKEIDIAFTRANNVLRMFITCLDISLIPETWDLKIKNEFFRLRFEVEGAPPRVPSDVNMSEAPGESGDDDPQANGQEKKAESDRNAKRTKNVEEKDGAQGGDMSAPKSSATAAGLNVMNCISPHVARYDSNCVNMNKSYLRPKFLFNAFSEVADVVGECMPTPDAVHSPGVQVDWTKNGDGDIGCELPGRTSLLYGDAVSRHAGKCLDVPAVQVLQASVPVPSPIGSPARLEGGPGVGLPGTSSRPVCGPGTERPNLHGTPAPMRCTPRIATSIAEAQVIASPILDGSNMNLNIQNFDKNNGVQGGLTVGGTPRDMHKGLPRTSPYTQEQIIAFGGIKEEKMRGVRSSGRLRAQPNSDVPLLERAMMLAEKRAEMPAIGTSASKPNSFIDFSDNHIIDSAISLGVSLGQSHSECIKAAALLKDVEAQRILTMLKGTDQLEGKNGNNTSCLVVSRASDLCDDLEGDDDFLCDEDEVVVPPTINKERKTRKKRSYDKKNIRKSNRIRIKSTKLQ